MVKSVDIPDLESGAAKRGGSNPSRATMIGTLKLSSKPRYKATLKEKLEFNGVKYQPGHEFNVINYDSMRGYDLQDKDGNQICDIRMILDMFDITEVV